MSSEKSISVSFDPHNANRRTFLKQVGGIVGGITLVGSAGAFLAACSENTSEPTGIGTPNPAATIMVDVSALDADGKSLVTAERDADGATILVHRVTAGVFESHSMKCTHAGCNLNAPSLVSGELVLQCPCHASNFNMSGMARMGPATGTLKSLTTTFDAGMNMVTIKLK